MKRLRQRCNRGAYGLAVKEKLFFLVPSIEPAFEGEERVIGEVDHPPHAVLFSLEEMDLSVPKIEIVEGETEGFTDPDAGPKKEQDEGPVPGVVDHGEELSSHPWGLWPGGGHRGA